jgi:hypothetical protein
MKSAACSQPLPKLDLEAQFLPFFNLSLRFATVPLQSEGNNYTARFGSFSANLSSLWTSAPETALNAQKCQSVIAG